MAKAILYTRSGCPYCVRVLRLFTSLDVPFEEVNLDGQPARRAALKTQYAWRTLPMVVVGERFLGGFDDVSELHADGELLPLLAA